VVAGHLISDGTSNVSLYGGLAVTSNLEVGSSNLFVDTVNSRVGVGTTTPEATLHVSGNAYVSSNLEVGSSNLFVDTVNSRVGVGTDTPKESLDVVGNMHLTRVSNVSQIKVDSNVVTEYTGPHDRPLRKYPEVALTANDNSSTSGYVADQTAFSGNADGYAYRLFDHSLSTAYQSGGSQYSSGDSTGSAQTTTATDGTTHQGVAITLDLATKIRLSYAKITSHTYYGRTPVEGTFLGSNNNSTWDVIGTFSGLSTTAAGQTHMVHISDYATKSAYRYIRLVVTKIHTSAVQNGGSLLEFRELEYYGYEEGSGSLDTTLKSVYNVPATTGTQLEVYYDGRETSSYSGSGTTVNDISPNTNNGTLNGGVGFDSTYKAFTFDGVDDYIDGTITTGIDAWSHTVAFWVKIDEFNGAPFFIIDPSADGADPAASTAPHLFANTNGTLNYAFWSNAGNFLDDNGNQLIAQKGVWQHYVVQYDASTGGTNYTDRKLIINGNQTYYPAAGTATALNMSASNNLHIGGRFNSSVSIFFNGSIANFRLYSKVLNADQVKELYDYQKDYFLGSKSQVTLYKGHLGVGVTEPSGQLELAGDERIQEYPPGPLTNYDTHIPGHGVFKVYASTDGESASGYLGWKAFDKIVDSLGWHDVGGPYTNGVYTGTQSLAGIKGEWIALKLPYAINLKSAATAPRSGQQFAVRGAGAGYILGSNDGNNWDQLHHFSGLTATDYRFTYINNINAPGYYTTFALLVTELAGAPSPTNTNSLNISEIKFFGTPGPTTLDKGSLSLTRSLDVPRISRYDVDTETPRPEKLVVDFDTTVNSSPTDISGKGNHGAFYGTNEHYSSADKAFNFDGGASYMYVPQITGATIDNWVHSISVWVFAPSHGETIFQIGHALGGQHENIGLETEATGKLRYYFYSNDVQTPTDSFPLNIWNHVVVTYDGGSVLTSRSVYINGVKQVINLAAGGTLAALDLQVANVGGYIGIQRGGGKPFYGKMSNFKIYSVALEPSEVKKLYNLGRTGRSMVISDTAVGIGKVPEAQLDVRGNLNVDGIITRPNQPMFSVSFKADTNGYVSVGNDINWDKIEIDTHNAYSAPNYTIPVSGYWYFFSHLYSDSIGTSDDEAKLVFNSVSSVYGNGTAYSRTANTGFGNLILQSIRYSTAGETVKISVNLGKVHYNSSAIAYFRGFMIG
jgi:hypothetical protein